MVARLAHNQQVVGSNPASASMLIVAQVVRAPGCDPGDAGSSPADHPSKQEAATLGD